MRVVSVQMRDFRTYARAEAALGEGLTVVHGPNGAGKSNLLEAIYFGCTARSPRTRNERELVRFGAQATRVVVQLADGSRTHELSVGYGTVPGSAGPVKRMTSDGAPVERLLDVEDRPLLSVFQPDRLELLKGSPTLRRAHLDQVVAAVWPLRASVRREYSRVLAQRNALLGRIRAGRASQATMATWDRELAGKAIALRANRAAAVALLAEPFADARLTARVQRRGGARLPPPLACRGRAGVPRRAAGPAAGRPRARLLRPRTPPRRAGDPPRRARAAPVRLPGRAAPCPAGAAPGRAGRARPRAKPHAADAPRRRDERAGPRAPRAARR